MLIFDIETGPLSQDQILKQVKPFKPPPPPGEFDPASIKLGNLKDQAKIAEKLAKAADDHAKAVKNHESTVAQQRQEWWDGIMEKAALSPLTGRVLAIGYYSTDSQRLILDSDPEPEMLKRFWVQYEKCRSQKRQMVGHNIFFFDVPFLVRRSWICGVDVPGTVLERGRYVDSHVFTDTMQIWACGSRDMTSLDDICKAFGIAGKMVDEEGEGIHGGMFAELLAKDPEKAKAYLENDLRMTTEVAERMGLI